MDIEWSILLALIGIWIVLFILGLFANIFVKTKNFLLLPVLGLVVFGGLVTPLVYIFGSFSFIFILIICIILAGTGVVFSLKGCNFKKIKFSNILNSWWWVILIGIFTAAGIILTSKYYIPGGIDSAIHSGIINGLLIQNQTVGVAYPLGIHILILFIERLTNLSQVAIFEGMNIFFQLSFIIVLYNIIKKWLNSRLAGLFVLVVSIIDVSFINNFLNGSISHLLGLILIAISILLLIIMNDKGIKRINIIFLILFSAFWYFHFISLFFALVALWSLRIFNNEKVLGSNLIVPIIGGIIISLPFQQHMIKDPTYLKISLPIIIGVLIIEIIYTYFSKYLKQFFSNFFIILISLPIFFWLFYNGYQGFLDLKTWYGISLLGLVAIGGSFITLTLKKLFYGFYYYLGALLLLYFLAQSEILNSHTDLFIELMYYYGFTIGFIIIGTLGIWSIFNTLSNKTVKFIFLTILICFSSFVLIIRTIDQQENFSQQPSERNISRYGETKGFGIYYSKDDIKLTEWIKDHIDQKEIIMNPGGLYNVWANLTEHQIVLSAYNVPTISNYQELEETTRDLLLGKNNVDFQQFINRNINYILLPENFNHEIFHQNVELVKQFGESRLYKIYENPITNNDFYSINLKAPGESMVKISGDFSSSCRYCGDPVYFTLKDALYRLLIQPSESVEIILPSNNIDKVLSIYLNSQSDKYKLTINGKQIQIKSSKIQPILDNYTIIRGNIDNLSITNISEEEVLSIDSFSVELRDK